MDTVISKLIPIFILAIIGFIAGKMKLLPENASDSICSFLFYFCAPAVAFANVMTSDPESIFNLRFALSILVFEFGCFLILIFLYKKIFRLEGTNLIIHGMCSMYGNISYVGIPVFLTLFNNAIPNIITILVHMMITFPFIIFLLDWFSGNGSGSSVSHAILSAVKNPNVFMPVLGALLLLLKVPVPQVIIDTADLLGKPTTSAGMFALGLTCAQSSRKITSADVFLHALLSTVMKLVFCPLAAYAVGRYLFHLDQWWLTSLVIIAMLPMALNDYILSQRYHADETYASVAVLMSNLLFSITISWYISFIGL